MAIERLNDCFSIRTGTVCYANLGYILAGDVELEEKDIAHTVVFEWDPEAGWGGHDLAWTAGALCVCEYPRKELVVVGRMGEFLILGQGNAREGVIPLKPTPSGDIAPMRHARTIEGKAYAVGMNAQVYRRDGDKLWVPLDDGLPPRFDIEAIDGFSEEHLIAVGWQGEIWRRLGEYWSREDSPTSLILTGVVCAGDGQAYACGQTGTILKSSGESWQIVEQKCTTEDFWGIEWYRDRIYISTTRFLYQLTHNGLELVTFGGDAPNSCLHLSTRDDVLWSIGQHDVMAFDGNSWSRIT